MKRRRKSIDIKGHRGRSKSDYTIKTDIHNFELNKKLQPVMNDRWRIESDIKKSKDHLKDLQNELNKTMGKHIDVRQLEHDISFQQRLIFHEEKELENLKKELKNSELPKNYRGSASEKRGRSLSDIDDEITILDNNNFVEGRQFINQKDKIDFIENMRETFYQFNTEFYNDLRRDLKRMNMKQLERRKLLRKNRDGWSRREIEDEFDFYSDINKDLKYLGKGEIKDEDYIEGIESDILQNQAITDNIYTLITDKYVDDDYFVDNFEAYYKIINKSVNLNELMKDSEKLTFKLLYSYSAGKGKVDDLELDYERFSQTINKYYNLFLYKDFKENSEFLFTHILVILIISITQAKEDFSNTKFESFTSSTPSPSPTPSPTPSPSLTSSDSDKFLKYYLEVVSLCLEVLRTKEKDSDLRFYRMKFYNKMKNFSEDIYDYILEKFNVPRNIFFINEIQIYYLNLLNRKKFKQTNYVISLYKKYYRDHEDKLYILKLDPKEQFKKVLEYGELEFERIQKEKKIMKRHSFKNI